MSFWTNAVQAKLHGLGEALATGIVNFDPDTAGEAEIMTQVDRVGTLAGRVAQAESKAAADAKVVADKEADRDRQYRAANILGQRLTAAKAGADAALIATLTADLTEQLGKVKTLDGELGDNDHGDRHNAAQSRDDVTYWTGVHQKAAVDLRTARQRMEQQKRSTARSVEEEHRSAERLAQAKSDAHLSQGSIDATHIALSAMEKREQAARERARANDLTANALRGSQSTSSNIASALAEADGAAVNAAAPDPLAELEALNSKRTGTGG